MTRAALFAIGLALCLSHCSGPARAAEVEVTPALVCHVQDAIRWHQGMSRKDIAAKLVALAHEAVQGA